ncbi:MAG: metalloregulator ArsR/SmtB family transcription factor [Candidatus Aenigmarchaeota archaeon]|nr:metalloregulator ArsR/SmtB family transcription factor [Candidatus Aenigmarchaeota archaeon]
MNKIVCERFFYTLADRNRLDIISLLLAGPKTVTEIHTGLDIKQSLASHHLKLLKDCGFVHAEARGKSKLYHLNRETIVPIFHILEAHATRYCGFACSCKAELWKSMQPAQAMDHETEVVMEKVAILERYSRQPGKVTDRSIKQMAAFFKGDMEQHFQMEERQVFPAARKAMDPELIDTLETEHRILRKKFAQLEALAEAKGQARAEGIKQLSLELVGLFKAHLEKEDGLLLPSLKAAGKQR